MKNKFLIAVMLMLVSNSAFALEYISGKVTILQPTELPARVTLQMDAGNATCPAGTWLQWNNPNPENVQGIYSTLMTALVSGNQISFIINDNDTSCTGQFIHFHHF